MEKELRERGPLLNEAGGLSEAGWARSLIKDYRRADIKAKGFRIKEWDYYLIANDHFGLALTIADNSYMSMVSASFLNFDERSEITRSVIKPFSFGKLKLPETSDQGDTEYLDGTVEMRFLNGGARRRLITHYLNFDGSDALDAEILLEERPKDSLVIATPYEEDEKAFYYNQKIPCMPAEGRVRIGRKTWTFDPIDSFAVLDWGRGVWTYSNTWYWSSASGLVDDVRFGFNLGYGFGDTSAASENILFYDGIGHKLDRVVFEIPGNDTKHPDFLSPWHIHDNEGRLDLTFEPFLDRASDTNVLIIQSDQHQVFGRFHGTAVLDDGTVLSIRDLTGFAEKVRNRW